MKILVVEDDPDIASNIGLYFEQQGHTLDFAYNGTLGLQLAKEQRFDLIILDLMLPGMDGITLCKRLREESPRFTPVLMLTARDTVNDKVEGFEAGADDYLVKPFSLRELEMRVNALTRRKFIEDKDLSYRCDELQLDPATREVRRADTLISLKPKAFAILQYLMQHQDRVVSRAELIDALWQDGAPEGDPLRVHIHHLRQKVDQPFAYPLIQTIHGVGYRIEKKPD
jgi:DNA-binding response OmpR family regulator